VAVELAAALATLASFTTFAALTTLAGAAVEAISTVTTARADGAAIAQTVITALSGLLLSGTGHNSAGTSTCRARALALTAGSDITHGYTLLRSLLLLLGSGTDGLDSLMGVGLLLLSLLNRGFSGFDDRQLGIGSIVIEQIEQISGTTVSHCL